MKKSLPLFGGIFLLLAMFLFLFAFFMRNLTTDQRWIVTMFFSVFVGIMAGCFTGSLEIRNANTYGFVITAVGGFGTWLLTPFFFPSPDDNAPVFVQLMRADNGSLNGDFSLNYRRSRSGSNLETGTAGKLTLNDLASGTTKLEVVSFAHEQLEIDAKQHNGLWIFQIDNDRYVSIPVVEKKPQKVNPEDRVFNLRGDTVAAVDALNEAIVRGESGRLVNANKMKKVQETCKNLAEQIAQIPDSNLTGIYCVLKSESIARCCALEANTIIELALERLGDSVDLTAQEEKTLAGLSATGLTAIESARKELDAPRDDSIAKNHSLLLTEGQIPQNIGFYGVELLGVKSLIEEGQSRVAVLDALQAELVRYPGFWTTTIPEESPILQVLEIKIENGNVVR